jgi:hypothetical protein
MAEEGTCGGKLRSRVMLAYLWVLVIVVALFCGVPLLAYKYHTSHHAPKTESKDVISSLFVE